jgi:hypothetical protein
MGWYFAWVLLHLGLLLICSTGIFDRNNMGVSKFWSFDSLNSYYSNLKVAYYDITEFLVYTIFPLAILIIWSMIRSQSKKEEK